ncbi:hypothetical protein EVAR_57027_1 [Eumeta japonica]|uniref:Uncharacterized protein n=1 Tax=Eumeta variegata TaxID=151549 RepID=A0A4C2AFY5_EUMVA|nr:hypothetical protein EVAR_57027_1 [Eumeta japonica]
MDVGLCTLRTSEIMGAVLFAYRSETVFDSFCGQLLGASTGLTLGTEREKETCPYAGEDEGGNRSVLITNAIIRSA